MAVASAPFRKELRGLQTLHPLFQSTHPFWHEAFRGRLQREDLRRWALDVYPVVRDFARLYLQVANRCESERMLTFLAETIFEETGSGIEGDSHPKLFRRFLNALGLADEALPEAAPTPAGQEVWRYSWNTVREGSFLEGLTLVGLGIERPLPAFFQLICRCFRRQYGLDEAALTFFAVHTVADVKHGQLAARLVAELARTPAQQRQVRSVLKGLWDLQQRQLDGLLPVQGER